MYILGSASLLIVKYIILKRVLVLSFVKVNFAVGISMSFHLFAVTLINNKL